MAETKALHQGKLIEEVASKQTTLVSGTSIKTLNGVSLLGSGDIATGSGDMTKAVYDTTNNGVVDNSELVNGLSVLTAVPSGALFTDTVYTHPTTDGSLHVPATSTTNNGKVLTAGATAGSFSWQTPTSGVTDHTLLSNIGTNTHTQIDTALTRLANTSGTNTGDQDLSGYSLTSHNHTVDGLSNVVITTNSDNEVLAWDSTTSKWINQTASEAGLATDTHTHTGVYEPADATILKDADIGVTVQAYNANTTTAGNTFNGASQLVQLNGTGQLPAIDGSLLTGITGGATTLDGLSDVVITTPSTGQVVKYNGTNWINDTDATGGGSSTLTIQDKTLAYTVVAGDLATIINCTSGTFTVSLTAAATLGAGFNCWIWNTSNTIADIITIDPNSTETISGISQRSLYRNQGVKIVSDGTKWIIGDQSKDLSIASNTSSALPAPIASGNKSVAISTESVASGVNALATQGGTASATGATVVGVNSSGASSQAVTGAGAMAIGGSYASGTDSFAAAIANNTSSYGATGANSVAIGKLSKASATESLAMMGAIIATTKSWGIGGAGFVQKVNESANSAQGVVTLVGGTVTVSNTLVTATSRIQLTSQVDGGTVGFLRVSARTAGVSFTITSSSATDTSTVAYIFTEPQ